MKDFVIFADSACDISPEILKSWGIPFCSLTFRFDGEDKEYGNHDMPISEFYQKMRDGGVAKTAAVNSEAFREAFEALAAEGKDILYLGFSSGLSTTCNSARIAANEVREKHPDCRIEIIDTLSASAGIGVMLRAVADKKEEGADLAIGLPLTILFISSAAAESARRRHSSATPSASSPLCTLTTRVTL